MSGLLRAAAVRSALGGEADVISTITDIADGMSEVGGTPDLPWTCPECRFLAISGNTVSCDHVFALTQTRSFELVQQDLGLLQVGGVEALGEPAVDRGEEITGLICFTLRLPQTGQRRCRAELQRFRFLMARGGQSSREGLFQAGGLCISGTVFDQVRADEAGTFLRLTELRQKSLEPPKGPKPGSMCRRISPERQPPTAPKIHFENRRQPGRYRSPRSNPMTVLNNWG